MNSNFMNRERIILVTDILPSKQMTAGNVLRQVHDVLQSEYELHYVNLYDRELSYEVYERIGSESIYVFAKPHTNWGNFSKKSTLSKMISLYGELVSQKDYKIIAKKIGILVSRIKPSTIIYVIESPASITIAKELMGSSKIYALGIYWDPVEWQLDISKISSIYKKRILDKNKELIKKFDSIIVPSENMSSYFKSMGGKNLISLHPFFD